MRMLKLLFAALVVCALLEAATAGGRKKDRTREQGRKRERRDGRRGNKQKPVCERCEPRDNVTRDNDRFVYSSGVCPDTDLPYANLNVSVNVTMILNNTVEYGLKELNRSLVNAIADLPQSDCVPSQRFRSKLDSPKKCRNLLRLSPRKKCRNLLRLSPLKTCRKGLIGKQKKKFRVLAELSWWMANIEASLLALQRSSVSGDLNKTISDARRTRGYLKTLGDIYRMDHTAKINCQRWDLEVLNMSESHQRLYVYAHLLDAQKAVEHMIGFLKECDASGKKLKCGTSVFYRGKGRKKQKTQQRKGEREKNQKTQQRKGEREKNQKALQRKGQEP